MTFRLTELATLGGTESYAYAINENRQVAGYAAIADNTAAHAVLWTVAKVTDLGTLGGASSYGYAINAGGQIAGYSETRDKQHNSGALWTDLGPDAVANGINAGGQIAGNVGASIRHAVAWAGAAPTDLHTLGGRESNATAINDSGWIVGYSETQGDSATRAVLWKGAIPTDLGTLGGNYSYAMAINRSGQVAGYAGLVGDSETHATLWNGAIRTDLGTLGGSSSMALGISDTGLLVGNSSIKGNSGTHATLWIGTKAYDLNDLLDSSGRGWTLVEARGINSAGQIVGWGLTPSGQKHAFLLTPTNPSRFRRKAARRTAPIDTPDQRRYPENLAGEPSTELAVESLLLRPIPLRMRSARFMVEHLT